MRFVETSSVGIVIPTYNDYAHLRQTLGFLREMTLAEAVVVVVNHGSDERTAELLAGTDDVVTVLGTDDFWWSAAINAGARELIDRDAEIIVMWNDDNVAGSRDCLEDLVRHVRETRTCASPVLVQRAPTGEAQVIHRGGEVDWPAGGLRLRDFGDPFTVSRTIDDVEWLSGSALVLTAATFVALGGVDERRFPQYRGDADITLRAVRSGVAASVLNWCWVENDFKRTGIRPTRRAGPRQFVKGLTSVGSSDHFPSMFRLVFSHCPSRLLGMWCLTIYYTKYAYWCLKTWR
jgi:GT2 family glycosyltransferase